METQLARNRKTLAGNSAFTALEEGVGASLQHYANVHRGAGHNSRISTELFERARAIVARSLAVDDTHVVIFCTPWRQKLLLAQLGPKARFKIASSQDVGLPLGLRAVAVRKRDLPGPTALPPGGGTIRMVSPGHVNWAAAPDLFEAGTPNITGAIAFARALQLRGAHGDIAFTAGCDEPSPADDVFLDGALAGLAGRELLDSLRDTQLGRSSLVPTTRGLRPFVHLDNGASTPTFAPIWQTVQKIWRQPARSHPAVVEKVRDMAHDFFGAPRAGYELLFAANTTEAIHVVAAGLRGIAEQNPGTVVLNSMIEHNSNELPWRYLPGVSLARLPVDRQGFLDLADLERVLGAYNRDHLRGDQRIRLVCLSGASNVMGSYNDIRQVAQLAHHFGARLLVDAAQLAAHRQIRMADDGIDYLVFSAHKMYAPFGSGGVIARRDALALAPDERAAITASGEENVAGIGALGMAMKLLGGIGMDVIRNEEQRLTQHALETMARVPGLKIHGIDSHLDKRFAAKGGVIAFELDGVPHNLAAQLIAEEGGIGVRSGCFCVNMYVKQLLGVGPLKNAFAQAGLTLAPDFVQKAMIGLVRVSFGLGNTEADIARLDETLARITARKASSGNRVLARLHLGTPFLPTAVTAAKTSKAIPRC